MGIFTQDGNRLVWENDAETLWIEPWGKNSLRVRATKGTEMPREDWALLPPEDCMPHIAFEGKTAQICNGRLTARISAIGKITFYDQYGAVLLEEFMRTREYDGSEDSSALEVRARAFKPILGGDYGLTVRFESDPGEKLYGMGQYQQPILNIKGCTLELAHRNSQASVPFVLSSLGYGLLWNNPAIGRVTFAKNLTEWEAYSTKQMDYWITAGDTPAQIEEAYACATGKVPMMPAFATGFWQCKLRYRTQEELLEVAREYKRRGLPLSVIVIDFFHWPAQGAWQFDPEYWPDPEAMVRELEEMGVKLMVSVWPTVSGDSPYYREMRERGYLVRADRGVPVTMQCFGDTVFFDATNPRAREYVWSKIEQNYYDKGIQVFWLDEAEPEYSAYDFDLYRYHLGPNLQVGNLYPVMYAKTFFDGMQKRGQENILNLLRCAWAGSQRYGALVWSGDIHSNFRAFRCQVAAGLNMGLAGIPWWTTDIGGFSGGNVEDPAFRELLARWFAYGAFCPVMRLHGDRDPKLPPLSEKGGGMCGSGGPNEVWSYGEKIYAILKKYLFIRENLRPYVEEQMRAAHEKGTPVMRPLFYDFPGDRACWEVEDAYLFGPDFLVAPVLSPGARSREVYLPADSEYWIDAWSGRLFHGGQTVACKTPLDQIPLFIRNTWRAQELLAMVRV